ncbi:RND family transporter [Gemmatimonadota bacterium]
MNKLPDYHGLERSGAAYTSVMLKARIPVLMGIMAVSLLSLPLFLDVTVQNRTEIWFRDGDPYYESYLRFTEEFGNDHVLIFGIQTERLFKPEVLNYLDRWVASVRNVTGVREVVTFTDMLSPDALDSLDTQRSLMISSPLVSGFLVSEDGTAAEMFVSVSEMGSQEYRDEIVREISDITNEMKPSGVSTYLSGSLFMGAEADRLTRESGRRFLWIAALGVAILLLLLLRRPTYVLMVLVAALLSVWWTFGLYLVAGNSVNVLTTIMLPLILAVSVATSIHIIEQYREISTDIISREGITAAAARIWLPCFLTSVTTAVGFFSLVLSPIKVLAVFGLYAAIAMIISFTVTFHVIPIGLSFHRGVMNPAWTSVWDGLLQAIVRLVTRYRRYVIAGFVVATTIGLYGVTTLRINTNQITYFPERYELVQGARFIDTEFGGSYPVQIVLRGDHRQHVAEPVVLKALQNFQTDITNHLQLQQYPSLADLILEFNARTGRERRLPDSTLETQLALGLMQNVPFASRLIQSITDSDNQTSRLTVRMRSDVEIEEMTETLQWLELTADYHFRQLGISTEITGMIPLYTHQADSVIRTQVWGFSFAFILIMAILGGLFLTLRGMFMAGIANALPIILTLGLMGILGIRLDTGTVMIAAVALGITVDDTIHLLYRWRRDSGATESSESSLPGAVTKVGRALITTTIIIGIGCLTLIVSPFLPIRHFGIMMAITMITALLADMLLIPTVLTKRYRA